MARKKVTKPTLASLQQQLGVIRRELKTQARLQIEYGAGINKRLDDVVTQVNDKFQQIEDDQDQHQREIDRLSAKGKDKTEPLKPAEYILTDADWQRVIDEKWLCEFGEGSEWWHIGQLHYRNAGVFRMGSGDIYTNCRPLNRPGVMQPYFGQGIPVPDGTKVLVLFDDGDYGTGTIKRALWSWDHRFDNKKVIAYMEIPRIK